LEVPVVNAPTAAFPLRPSVETVLSAGGLIHDAAGAPFSLFGCAGGALLLALRVALSVDAAGGVGAFDFAGAGSMDFDSPAFESTD
jgi:hypothetical protein